MLGTLAEGWPIDEAINNPRDDESWRIAELLRTNAERICRVDGAAAAPSLTV